jgi:hypothetical protein
MTPSQQENMLKALDKYLTDARSEAERIVKDQYMVGKHTVMDSVYPGLRGFMSDPEKVFANGLVRGNVDLISGFSKKYLGEVESLTRQALEGNISPNDLITMFNKADLKFASSAKVVAYDQVAKAQELGRNTEYAQLGVEYVDVSVAPDACEICQSKVSDKPVHISDVDNRPQFHIECLCFDLPSTSEAKSIRAACLASMEEKSASNYLTKPADYTQVLCKMGADGGACEAWSKESDLDKPMTLDQFDKVNSEMKQGFDEYYSKLNDADRSLIGQYQEGYIGNSNYVDINESISKYGYDKTMGMLDSETRAAFSRIEELVDMGKLPHDMTLFRGLGCSDSEIANIGKMIGTSLDNPGLMATSIDSGQAAGFPSMFYENGYLLQISIPEGTPALFANSITTGETAEIFESQLEVLFGCGHKLKIIDIVLKEIYVPGGMGGGTETMNVVIAQLVK